jgi:4-amino-4-deoxy-L-arabinose transferase-like glycosyltransferase
MEAMPDPPGLGRATWWTVAALAAARLALVVSGAYDLSPDEAYFWEWARHPAFGYYDQGPAVAWILRAGTAVFGDTALGVRAGAILFSSATLLLLATLVRRLGGSRRAGLLATLAVSLTPLGHVNSFIMTYYLPQLLLWALGMLTLWKIREEPGAPEPWLVLGLVLGLGGLTHHTFVWLGLVALAWLVWAPGPRRAFAGPWPWASLVVAAALVLPYVAWNARHDWVGIRHALSLVDVGQPTWRGLQWRGVLWYAGGQFAVLTPVYFAAGLVAIGAAAAAAVRGGRGAASPVPPAPDGDFDASRAAARLLALGTWPLFLYVATLAWAGRSEANWTSAATLGLGAAWALRQDGAWRRRGRMPLTVPACLATALLCTVAMHGAPLLWRAGFHFHDPSHDPLHRLHGWRELGRAAFAERESLAAEGPTVTATVDDYAMPAELSFYAPDHAPTFCPPVGRRHHQYDFWPACAPPPGGNAVWVTRQPLAADNPVRPLFRSWSAPRRLDIVEPASGVLRRSFYLYRCRGFTGQAGGGARGY